MQDKLNQLVKYWCGDNVKQCWMNLVTVAQVAVALPAAGTGAAEARSGLRDGGLRAQRRVLVLAADKFCLRWCALLHLPQTCCNACRHGNAAAADADWNRHRVKRRWLDRKTKRLHWWNVWQWRDDLECGNGIIHLAWLWVSDLALRLFCKYRPTQEVRSCPESPNTKCNTLHL